MVPNTAESPQNRLPDNISQNAQANQPDSEPGENQDSREDEPPGVTTAGGDNAPETKPEEVPVPENDWSSSEEGLYMHMEDHWKIQDNQVIRQHVAPRITLFCPTNINTCTP